MSLNFAAGSISTLNLYASYDDDFVEIISGLEIFSSISDIHDSSIWERDQF